VFEPIESRIVDRTSQLHAVAEILKEGLSEAAATIQIRGDCMMPQLANGAEIAVKRAKLILPGDVLVFRSSTGLTAHRVVGYWYLEARLALVTKGDHCAHHDGVVAFDRVIGVVQTRIGLRSRFHAMGSFVRLIAARLRR